MAKTAEEWEVLLKDLTADQLQDVLYYIAILKAKRNGVDAATLVKLVSNWELLRKLIFILK